MTLQAQPVRGTVARPVAGARVGNGARNGARGHSHARGRNGAVYPLGYGDLGYGYDEPVEQVGPDGEPMGPPPMMMMAPGQARAPRVPSGAKVVEIPGMANAANSKPLPPAVFILRNGERVEAQQYLLTYDHVDVTSDREQRTIPLSTLDVKATVAANHQRGIDLRIPNGHGEVSVGF
jgi:hypothetical protein